MTKEEALKVLDTIPTIGEQVDALEIAIEALEQESILDKIRAEIERHRRKTQSIDPYDLVGDCLEIIDKYRAESEVKE
jgi:hypothetical protein